MIVALAVVFLYVLAAFMIWEFGREKGVNWEAKSAKQHALAGLGVLIATILLLSPLLLLPLPAKVVFAILVPLVSIPVALWSGLLHEWCDHSFRPVWLVKVFKDNNLGPANPGSPWQGVLEALQWLPAPLAYAFVAALLR